MSDDPSKLPINFGRGTTPRRVREEIERVAEQRERSRPPTSTSERDRYFKAVHDLIERAGGRP